MSRILEITQTCYTGSGIHTVPGSSAVIHDTLGGMIKKAAYRAKAVTLRKKGLSYNEIRREVPVSKSSLSLWLKHVPLSPRHRARLYTKQIQILSRGSQSQHERRKREVDKIIADAKAEVHLPLSKDTFKFLGAALYWAEGSKTKNFEVTNSDPLLIAFMVQWFHKTFDVPPKSFKAHLNIYPQQNEIDIKRFWSSLTGIPLSNFGKSFIKPLNKGYKKNNLYYGTIKVRVPKGTDMKLKVFGWIQGALQELSSKIESTQRKWLFVTKVDRNPVNLTPHSLMVKLRSLKP